MQRCESLEITMYTGDAGHSAAIPITMPPFRISEHLPSITQFSQAHRQAWEEGVQDKMDTWFFPIKERKGLNKLTAS